MILVIFSNGETPIISKVCKDIGDSNVFIKQTNIDTEYKYKVNIVKIVDILYEINNGDLFSL